MEKKKTAACASPGNAEPTPHYEELKKTAAIRHEPRRIEDLNPAVYNPRKALKPGDEEYERLKVSIETFGYVDPIIVNADGTVIGGHQRLTVLTDLGYTEVEVSVVDLNKNDEKALNIALNKIAGEWDDEKLAAIFHDLQVDGYDTTVTGFDEEEVADLLASAIYEESTLPEDSDLDAEVEPPKTPTSKLGDVWQLGRHRVICGDSTDVAVLKTLMGDELCDLWLTDPPYNVALGMGGSFDEARKRHRRTDGLVIMNDKMESEEFFNFLVSAFKAAQEVMRPGAAFYIWYADTEGLNFRSALQASGLQMRQNLIWNKNTFTLGRQDYQWKHEPCLYGWKDGASHSWESDRKQTTVLDFDKPMRSAEHPTMKPVALFQYQIENSSKVGQIVFDSFGGSGTTMVACEASGRNARLTELDPRYVDVIVKRYMTVTGRRDVVLTRDGKEIPVEDTGILDEGAAEK